MTHEDMPEVIFKLTELFNHNLNILIGSGASADAYPTLALPFRDGNGQKVSFEDYVERADSEEKKALLFMHYYAKCIEPAATDVDDRSNILFFDTVSQYEAFLITCLDLLRRRNSGRRRINIFTTNYDTCFEKAAERIFSSGDSDFVLNDGTEGFSRKILLGRNFSRTVLHEGTYGQSATEIPQINLIHLHGSVRWKRRGTEINVDYHSPHNSLLTSLQRSYVNDLDSQFRQEGVIESDITFPTMDSDDAKVFQDEYKKLPIVNPTKWKFHETLFEQHYYQMLRTLSYQLEKPNSVLLTFGFSFADEHIFNLVARALTNPTLQLFICCYNSVEKIRMQHLFKSHRNVNYVAFDENLTIKKFNEEVFVLKPSPIANNSDAATSSVGVEAP